MIKMVKWSMVFVALLLNVLCPCNADPVPDPVPDPDIVIEVSQVVGGSGGCGSQGCKEKITDEHSEGEEHTTVPTTTVPTTTVPTTKHSEENCSHWSYPSTNWPSICPQFCSGSSQSPIDIVTATAVGFTATFNASHCMDSTPATVNIKNNGHSATVSVNEVPEMTGGGPKDNYTLAQFHFHWGCENSRGSEHTVNGTSYPMELHLVHYKTSYGSLGEAIKHSDGLAVIGIFYNIGTENDALKPITDNLSQITAAGTDVDIPYNTSLRSIFPTELEYYFNYKGSLTTPTCNEVVNWNVLKNINQLSQAQLDALRSLQDHDGNPMCDNYREVQPLNGRTVFFDTL